MTGQRALWWAATTTMVVCHGGRVPAGDVVIEFVVFPVHIVEPGAT
jgi:hypothetical protein